VNIILFGSFNVCFNSMVTLSVPSIGAADGCVPSSKQLSCSSTMGFSHELSSEYNKLCMHVIFYFEV
jgi:hypothetical protein